MPASRRRRYSGGWPSQSTSGPRQRDGGSRPGVRGSSSSPESTRTAVGACPVPARSAEVPRRPLLPRTVSGTVPGMHAHYSFLTGLACRSARWEAGTRPAGTGRLLSCRSRVHRLLPSVPAPARPLSSRRAAVRSPKPATLPRRRSPARDRPSSSR